MPKIAQFATVICLLLCSIGSQLNGQNLYLDQCQRKLDSLTEPTLDRFVALLQYVEILKDQDLGQALKKAQELPVLAKQLADKTERADAIELAKHWNLYLSTRLGRTQPSHDDTVNLSNTPDNRLRFFAALLEIESRLAFRSVKYQSTQFDEATLIVSKLDSSELQMRLLALQVFAQLSKFGDDQLSKIPTEDIDLLTRLSVANNDPDGNTLATLVEAYSSDLEIHQVEARLKKAKLTAEESGNRALQIMATKGLAFLDSVGKEKQLDHINEAVSTCDKLGCAYTRNEMKLLLAIHQKKLGLIEESKKTFEEVRAEGNRILASVTDKKRLAHIIDLFTTGTGSNRSPESLVETSALQKEETKIEQALSKYYETRLLNSQLLEQRDAKFESRMTGVYQSIKNYLAVGLATAFALVFGLFFVAKKSFKNMAEANARKTEEQALELSRRLARIEKRESIENMAGSVAHNVNNILSSVINNAELILINEDQNDTSMTQQTAGNIIDSAQKAAALSKHMLAVAGKQPLDIRRLELNNLITDCASNLDEFCSIGHSIELNLAAIPAFCLGDENEIKRVLISLIRHTIKYCQPKQIVVSTGTEVVSAPEDDPSLFGKRTVGGKFSYFELAFDGELVESGLQHRVFDPFYFDKTREFGMELSASLGVIESHDGFIRYGKHAQFQNSFRVLIESATIPTSPEPVAPVAVLETPRNQRSTDNILIVDDDKGVRETCDLLVQSLGYRTETAENGQEALDRIFGNSELPDCILLDMHMPVLSGDQVLAELESSQTLVPIVVVTGFSDTDVNALLEFENVVEVITKPFRVAELEYAITRAISVSSLNRQDSKPGDPNLPS